MLAASKLGKINTLRVVAQYPFGYALAPLVEINDENDSVIEIDDAEELQTVTLAIDEVETSLTAGQQVNVFVATDQRGDLQSLFQSIDTTSWRW